MPLDAIFLAALSRELRHRLIGAKIDKIQQPERDKLVFSLRGGGENFRLLLSCGTGSARVHVTTEVIENPASPPMFCMLMRKHLVGARIAELHQPSMERMLIFELDTTDELGVAARKKLVVELMGRGSNIILVGADGRIIDAVRRIDADLGQRRPVLPGLLYRDPPKQDKTDFLLAESEARAALWAAAPEDKTADSWLLDSFSGLSPLIARELCHRAFGETSPHIGTLGALRGNLPAAMDALAESIEHGEFTPWLLSEVGLPRDFSFMPIRQYGARYAGETAESFSALLDAYYMKRDKAERMRVRSQSLTKHVKTHRDRVERKLALQREELKKTADREEARRRGDLITANIYRMRRGDSLLECEDYYTEGQPTVAIPLDARKTPQQNAAAYYKEYNKAKTAEQHLTVLIEKGEQELDYLNSVLSELAQAESERDLGDIRRELLETGYVREQKGEKRMKLPKNEPLRYVTPAGLEILVGKNNAQNDYLTTKLADRGDIWLHTQKIHGSHVILRCGFTEPDEESLLMAASLAAWYSQGRDGGKVPVDYTRVRYVKKPSGAMPGKVIYTDYRTLMVQPAEPAGH